MDHPGSAIRYGDKFYELMRIEETIEEGFRFRYGLRSWDSRHLIRHWVDYTIESQMTNAAAHLEEIKTDRLHDWILWLFPLAGFAPDPLQREWGKKTGLNVAWISAGSALFGMGLAFLLRGASQHTLFEAAVLYLALESFVRLFWIVMTGQPHGTPLLTAPYLLWQAHEHRIPRTPDRQKAVEGFAHRTDLAHSFALVWGLYPRRDQIRLQLSHRYDGQRSTAVTAGIFLAVGLLQLCLTAPLYRVTILALVGPAYLVLESVWRLYRAKALGEPAGSVVGYALRLVIQPPK